VRQEQKGCGMRTSPSIAPDIERDVYLVLDDFGPMGCAWRETNARDAVLGAVIQDLLEGQNRNPVRVIAFNVAEGWVRDVSAEVAQKLRQHCDEGSSELPAALHQFVEDSGR
jgi:hypothetical protein